MVDDVNNNVGFNNNMPSLNFRKNISNNNYSSIWGAVKTSPAAVGCLSDYFTEAIPNIDLDGNVKSCTKKFYNDKELTTIDIITYDKNGNSITERSEKPDGSLIELIETTYYANEKLKTIVYKDATGIKNSNEFYYQDSINIVVNKDENGQITGGTEAVYDRNGDVISFTVKGSNGEVRWVTERTYDYSGRIKTIITKDANNQLKMSTEFYYKNDRRIKIAKDKTGQVKYIEETTYDNKENQIEKVTKDIDGNITEKVNTTIDQENRTVTEEFIGKNNKLLKIQIFTYEDNQYTRSGFFRENSGDIIDVKTTIPSEESK